MAGLADVTARNANCTDMAAKIDAAGAGSSALAFFTDNTAAVETARCPLNQTNAFAAPSNGVMAFATGSSDTNAAGGAGATTTYFQVRDKDDAPWFAGTVSGDTGGSGDIQFTTGGATVTINAGDTVNITWASTTYTAPPSDP